MKTLITLLLMLSIQITFIDKVMASVSLSVNAMQIHSDCTMEGDSAKGMMNHLNSDNSDCAHDCELMALFSLADGGEPYNLLTINEKKLNYPVFITPLLSIETSNLYRPPLLS